MAPPFRHAKTTIPPTAGTLRLAIVADTHSYPHPALIGLLRARAPHAILHAGDIGDHAVLDDLAAVAPLHAVRGNIDVRGLPDVLTLDVGGLFTALLLHIGVSGPRLRADAARRARESGASLVICGHSHVPFLGRDKGLVVFNPGSVGPRRFQLPIVFGWLEIDADGTRFEHVDAETGRRWAPP